MKRRGQKLKLRHQETGEVVEIVVVLADSKQGYLGGSIKDVSPMVLRSLEKQEWSWYHPSEWSELK
jgi:hypothetical protein